MSPTWRGLKREVIGVPCYCWKRVEEGSRK
jgi:hypothetical protein